MKARDPSWRTHTRRESLDMREAWERNASSYIAWARKPGHDSYWRFHRDLFFEIVPKPGRLTLDLGCGEGRLTRDLAALGHSVVAVDASRTMVAHAKDSDTSLTVLAADAAALPFADGCIDLAVAFMSLQDVDDLRGAIAEAARVLTVKGVLCVAIVHPINSAGHFEDLEDASPFIIPGSYLDAFYYEDRLEREGLETTFASAHRPLGAYTEALAREGFLIDLLREPAMPDVASPRRGDRRWKRVPMFLHLRAIRA